MSKRSSAKAKGTSYEGLCRRWWKEIVGFQVFDPAPLGTPGSDMVLLEAPYLRGECKNQKSMALSGWLKQANEDAIEAGAQFGFVQHKKRGIGNHVELENGLGEHYVTLRATDFARILKTLAANKIVELEPLD